MESDALVIYAENDPVPGVAKPGPHQIYRNPRVAVESRSMGKLAPHCIRLEMIYAGVCGTDLHLVGKDPLTGYVKTSCPMNLPPEGRVFGHEGIGRVIEVGSGVSGLKPGALVALESIEVCHRCDRCRRGQFNQCRHSSLLGMEQDGLFATVADVPASLAYDVSGLAGGDDDLRALACLEPAGVAMVACRNGGLKAEDSVVVFGAGPIGVLCAMLARTLYGARRVHVVEPSDFRREFARGHADAVFTPEEFFSSDIEDVDVVFEASGVMENLDRSLPRMNAGGRLVVLARGGRPLTLNTTGPPDHQRRLDHRVARASGRRVPGADRALPRRPVQSRASRDRSRRRTPRVGGLARRAREGCRPFMQDARPNKTKRGRRPEDRMNANENREHWQAMARAWDQSGAPLRPSPQDVAVYHRRAREWMDGRRIAPRVLLLGVTPEIYNLPWPEGRDFLAVDRTPAMIAHVWKGKPEEVLRAGWLELPLPPASRDIALCDGGLHLLGYPYGQKRLADRLHEVLAPGGRCIFRLFTPPREKESAGVVLDDLLAGRVANLNVLKLRLGMALQESAEEGVAVKDVWRTLRALAPDWETLASRLGWPAGHLATIDVYRESDARYHFMSAERVTELFCGDGRFASLGWDAPGYDLGERCPVVVFERR